MRSHPSLINTVSIPIPLIYRHLGSLVNSPFDCPSVPHSLPNYLFSLLCQHLPNFITFLSLSWILFQSMNILNNPLSYVSLLITFYDIFHFIATAIPLFFLVQHLYKYSMFSINPTVFSPLSLYRHKPIIL